MVYQTVKELTDALKPFATVMTDRVTVSGEAPPEAIDALVHTAVFGADPELCGTARWVIHRLANHAGILPWDATMMSVALLRYHPLPRHARFLVLNWAFQLP